MKEARKSILWLKSGPLHPLDSGGKKRTFNMLKELCHNFEVTYLALKTPTESSENLKAASAYAHKQVWIPWSVPGKRSLRFGWDLLCNLVASDRPVVIDRYRSKEMEEAILEMAENFDLIICDFLTPAVNLPKGLQVPVVIFQHNVESMIWRRLAENARTPVHRWYLSQQYDRMCKFEEDACRAAQGVVAVSEQDQCTFETDYGLTNVLGACQTGVDTEFFRPDPKNQPEPQTIAFLGSMDWHANIDGVTYFASEIYPLIKKAHPGVEFLIIGRNPPKVVEDLAAQDSSITVTGTVDDIRPYVHRSRVLVVPLRVGGGTRIKIFEAAAMGVAVVSTAIGAEGLPMEDEKEILLRDKPEDFAQGVIDLLSDGGRADALARGGRTLVEREFSWAPVTEEFAEICFRAG